MRLTPRASEKQEILERVIEDIRNQTFRQADALRRLPPQFRNRVPRKALASGESTVQLVADLVGTRSVDERIAALKSKR